jgi:lipopolysaccharide transport system permease protein
MADERITTYLPDNSLRRGYASLFSDIVRELVESRWLIYQMFKRELFAFYKQSLLGGLWLMILPLVTVGTFVLLRNSGVMNSESLYAPYPIYAGLGVAIWQLFSTGVVSGANSLVVGADMISRINFSKKSLVIAAMGRALASFAVMLLLVLVLLAVYAGRGFEYAPGWGALLAPIALVPIFLLTLGLSFYMALLNAIMRDVGSFLPMLLTFLMLLTPILYARPSPSADWAAQLMSVLTEYNPLYYLIAGPRDLAILGRISEWKGFGISSLLSLTIFVLSLIGFHLTEARVAERV